MKCAFLLFGLLLSLPVLAEPSLGRLFYTPEERAAIEVQKGRRDAPEATTPYQGLILRGTGAMTVWQDGAARDLPPEADKAEAWQNVGGARNELLRGGHVVAHPGKRAREKK